MSDQEHEKVEVEIDRDSIEEPSVPQPDEGAAPGQEPDSNPADAPQDAPADDDK